MTEAGDGTGAPRRQIRHGAPRVTGPTPPPPRRGAPRVTGPTPPPPRRRGAPGTAPTPASEPGGDGPPIPFAAPAAPSSDRPGGGPTPPPRPDPATRSGVGRRALAVAAVLVVAVVVGALFVTLGGDDGNNPAQVATEGTDGVDTGEGVNDGTGANEEDTASTVVPPTTPTVPETTAVPRPPPAVTGWAALFVSDPERGPVDALAATLGARLTQPVDVFHSDDYASLRAGYWVAAVRGLANPDAALDVCYQLGRTTSDQCAARRLLNGPGITWDEPAGSGTPNPAYIAFP